MGKLWKITTCFMGKPWIITMFHGKPHYFNGHFQQQTVTVMTRESPCGIATELWPCIRSQRFGDHPSPRSNCRHGCRDTITFYRMFKSMMPQKLFSRSYLLYHIHEFSVQENLIYIPKGFPSCRYDSRQFDNRSQRYCSITLLHKPQQKSTHHVVII